MSFLGFLDAARDEMYRLNEDEATSLAASLCLGAITAMAHPDVSRVDIEARSVKAFAEGPYVEISGGVAVAYCAKFDDSNCVENIIVLHAGASAPTGIPPLTWAWRKTATERFQAYKLRGEL